MDMLLLIFSISKLIEASFGFQISVEGSTTTADIEDINATLTLNCSYIENTGEINAGQAIYWRKSEDENLVSFAKPGGADPVYYPDGEYLQNRSELIKPTENSSYALVIINKVVCEDERPSYECLIAYTLNGLKTALSRKISMSLQKSSKQPFDIPLISSTELEENQELELSCVGDVGKPPGVLKWWKVRNNNDFSLIKESDEIPNEDGNCEFITSVNYTYSVTRDDNGAFFRCTSHNNITKNEDPEDILQNRDTVKINVLYKATVLSLIRVPELDVYPISTPTLNLTCIADGNPGPTEGDYKWTFQPFHSNTTEEKNSNGKFLLFQNLQEADSGTYTCSVTNTLNSTHSLNVTINVNGTIPEPKFSLHCHSNPCGALENCVETGHEYKCETNSMGVVGVIFIVVTIASLAVSFGLAYSLRKLHKVSQIGVQNSKISNGNATTLPMTETTGDLNTHNGTVPSNETNDAVYAQIKKT